MLIPWKTTDNNIMHTGTHTHVHVLVAHCSCYDNLDQLCSDAIISCGVIMMNEKFEFFEEIGIQKGNALYRLTNPILAHT